MNNFSLGNLILEKALRDENLVNLFWSQIEKVNDCWHWKGPRGKGGYGAFNIPGKSYRIPAHRFSFAFVKGSSTSLDILHRCDNIICVNPFHLFSGTQQDNVRDRHLKGRTHHKTSFEDRVKILALYQSGLNQTQIAKQYNVDPSVICRIVNKKRSYK